MPRPKIKARPAKRSMNPIAIPMKSKTRTISPKSASLRRYKVTRPRRTSTTPAACAVRTKPELLRCYLRDSEDPGIRDLGSCHDDRSERKGRTRLRQFGFEPLTHEKECDDVLPVQPESARLVVVARGVSGERGSSWVILFDITSVFPRFRVCLKPN